MKVPYGTSDYSLEATTLAKKIVAEILSSGVTFQTADQALSAAQKMLWETTRPIRAETPL